VKLTRLATGSLFAAALVGTACGTQNFNERGAPSHTSEALSAPTADADTAAFASGAATLAGTAFDVSVDFRYENAKPRIVNGKPVLDHRYWACVESVTVDFKKPMRLATVQGRVFLQNDYNSRRALIVDRVDAAHQTFVFKSAEASYCNDHTRINELFISREARAVSGEALARDFEAKLEFPPSRDTMPGGGISDMPGGGISGAANVGWGGRASGGSCREGSGDCISVSAERLNRAVAGMQDWMQSDKANAIYRSGGLELMPLDYLMQPFHPANRRRQYGSPDLLYVLRRAARFTQLLFPSLGEIPIADMSEADGGTPQLDGLLLHPEGSHRNGRDADVAYITKGRGNEVDKGWDQEKNFWFLYGVLQSTGVDLVMTAYKAEYVELAREAHRKGLINSLAVGRFNMLMQDTNMNHDKHFHVSVGNANNGYQSRRFKASDDVYTCYLSLRPDLNGGERNYCADE
jgi:hypothetical protein